MKLIGILSLMLFSSLSFAQHHSGGITNAKIAELSSHRVGRLVDTGKIPEEFVTNLEQIQVTVLPGGAMGQPAYKVNVRQPLNQSGSQSDVTLLFDMNGKFLSYLTVLADQTGTQVDWPDLSVTEIVESALHFITEQSPPEINMKPFNDALNTLKIGQRTNNDGSLVAVVLVDSPLTEKTLEVELSMEGKILGFKTY